MLSFGIDKLYLMIYNYMCVYYNCFQQILTRLHFTKAVISCIQSVPKVCYKINNMFIDVFTVLWYNKIVINLTIMSITAEPH